MPVTSKTPIRFGTDGWRAIIAKDFTVENVQVIAQAVADYLHAEGTADRGVAVAYDTRFMSEYFASTLSIVLTNNGIKVHMCNNHTPTPVLSYYTKKKKLAAGVMITASHNPCIYNGVKFKASYGGPAMPEMTRAIEKQLLRRKPRNAPNFDRKLLNFVDMMKPYTSCIRRYIKRDLINNFKGEVLYDSMYGAGTWQFDELFEKITGKCVALRKRLDPRFFGRGPEPIPSNLKNLKDAIRKHAYSGSSNVIGFATDGDADRFGVLDERGEFVQLHDLMPLLFRHLLETRGWKGDVVRTTSMADTIDQIAAAHGREVVEVPVGFKNVAEQMLAREVLIGGEESGGFGYARHIPERDGLLSCLLVLEMLGATGRTIGELVRGLREEFGPFAYDRIDQYADLALLKRNMKSLKKNLPDKLDRYKVLRANTIDGVKFYFTNGAWLLLRTSDTEPLCRAYCAAHSPEIVRRLLKAGIKLLTAGVLSERGDTSSWTG